MLLGFGGAIVGHGSGGWFIQDRREVGFVVDTGLHLGTRLGCAWPNILGRVVEGELDVRDGWLVLLGL